MAKSAQRRSSRLRRIVRWCALLLLLAVLAAVSGGMYLRNVGLPDFLKRPLLAQLHAKGVQLNFTRARWRWYRGIVVDGATFTLLKPSAHPKFFSVETELNLDLRSLFDSRFHLNSVTVQKGNFVWPISETNQLSLSVSNVTARIRFPSENEMRLEQLEGDFADVPLKFRESSPIFTKRACGKFSSPAKKEKAKADRSASPKPCKRFICAAIPS